MESTARRTKTMIAAGEAGTTTNPARWRTVEEAAAFLSMPAGVLREELARNARSEGGAIEARVDGILGRKLGRCWKVWLSEKWTAPESAQRTERRRGGGSLAVNEGRVEEARLHGRS